ncbi:MAG: hypothetical protein JSS81_04775 [Acidobacteria bacterium]|nr:hypothetical protein [Acidobacteriota bacterium]
MKCTACGSTALVEGTLMDANSTGDISFKIEESSLIKRIFGIRNNRPVHAYGCVHCHHLQLAVDFSEADLERYQEFEGQQPGVLERINS